MKVGCLDKLRFTSIKYGEGIIHFKYNNEYYVLQNGGTDCTLVIRLFKGRTKYKVEHISSNYGMIRGLIKYKHNKKVLSSIDKWHFVRELIKADILEPTREQQEMIVKEKIKELVLQKGKIQQQIDELLENKGDE